MRRSDDDVMKEARRLLTARNDEEGTVHSVPAREGRLYSLLWVLGAVSGEDRGPKIMTRERAKELLDRLQADASKNQ